MAGRTQFSTTYGFSVGVRVYRNSTSKRFIKGVERVRIVRVGETTMRLADGPVWHYRYIRLLAPRIVEFMVEEIGEEETLKKFAHPIWFQAFSTVLGFEWQFSGSTTVPIRALKEGLPEDFPIKVYGGKGKVEVPEEWKEVSRRTAKFDSAAFQDGYSLYFHALLTDEEHWVVLNQGMNPEEKLARRYHWSWEEGEAAAGRKERYALVFGEQNEEAKKAVVDIVQDESPKRIVYTILTLRKMTEGQRTLFDWEEGRVNLQEMPYYLKIPERVSEKALEIARSVSSFSELLLVPGLGAATLRGLAYIAYLVYDVPLSWEDPVLFTYAFGTKVGVPYMVNTEAMVEAARFFKEAVEEIRVGEKERRFLLRNLWRLVKDVPEESRESASGGADTFGKNKAQSGRQEKGVQEVPA